MTTPLGTSVLALATTVHVALLLLRQHRSFPARAFAPLLLPSLAFSAQPWVLPSADWVLTTIAVHLVWFLACEALLRAPAVSAAGRTESPGRLELAAAPSPVPGPLSANATPAARLPSATVAPVLAVIEESESIRTFRLARPQGFAFTAGQFLTVRVQVDGKPIARCYSISSAPEASGFLEISVRCQGKVSGVMHATLRPGSQLTIARPAGRFVYPKDDERPLVLLAGGIGITPLLSMLRHGLSAQPGRPIALLYSARTVADLAFADELLLLGRRHPQLAVHLLATRERPEAPFLHGRIDGETIARLVPGAAEAITMICGPQAMIDALTKALHELGAPAGQVRSEAFAPAAAAREGAVHVTTPSREEVVAGPRTIFTLTLARSNLVVPVSRRETLLDAVEAAGGELPNSCRSGMCLT
jgi:ferredoxin-NADP reductase